MQPLFVCALDDSIWLSEEEAVSHILRKHFATFYQAERTATEPPKGKYTFVAQCGMSGAILGPPNYHDYQNQLRKLHAERFSRMPFDVFKARVKIVRDEAVVKQWVDDQSWKTEYVCLNLPEPLKLTSMEAVEKHFREVHKENIIKSVESHRMSGPAARAIRSPELARLVRTVVEDQRRFPLQIATSLSQQFASHGLQFFKVNKSITHVAVARPHFLDLSLTPVSDSVKRIVDYINANPRSTRKQLVESLAPTPPPSQTVPETAPAPAEAQPVAAPTPGPTPEQTVVISDLHWLIHQGHVIEFANGTLECAKKPLPKPPRPEKPKQVQAAPSGEQAAQDSAAPAAPTEPAPVLEGTAEQTADEASTGSEPESLAPAGGSEVQTPVSDSAGTESSGSLPAEASGDMPPEAELTPAKPAEQAVPAPEPPPATSQP